MGIAVGDTVRWNWGSGTGTGAVTERFTSKVTCRIKGTDVTRDGSVSDPAFLIEQEDGDIVLKSNSELERI
ncbi:DUF2945 domain-containing protein [Roseovarius sp. LXJ103]|uniref:DUF2945 domain-containing protein n=1 Tax=Roseovarius carneus TaxID=2853164 RepID=UPI000D6161EC|nr:DUF2945 domain-containing protein [Roseovarius carneus]MBZ8117993.1 DUF2945 domain-containing protein [Roseovarius carneus]PWE36258.1 hypothetical protein DD563_10010 [Pelagicola sp. LXJ1103]